MPWTLLSPNTIDTRLDKTLSVLFVSNTVSRPQLRKFKTCSSKMQHESVLVLDLSQQNYRVSMTLTRFNLASCTECQSALVILVGTVQSLLSPDYNCLPGELGWQACSF